MDYVRQRIANLSPEKRALLELRLMQQRTEHTPVETMSRRHTTAPCALSFAQQRLWFLAQLEPDSAHYNEPKAMRIYGALDVALLQQTLDAIVERHEALRTSFIAIDGTPRQVVAEKQSVALPLIDLRAWPEATREAEMQRHLSEAIQHPFDLTRDVLLRALLIRVRDEDHVLLLVTHHIASDGWSTGILFREIDAFYTAFATGNPVALPELPVQYADYALWQHQWLQGERLAEQLAYWKQQLAGAPGLLTLPTDHPRPAIQTWHGTRHIQNLPAALTTELTHVSRQAGVTLFMTLLAAFHTLLYRYTGQEDIVVGVPIAGRTRKETEHLIGFFVNSLALRTRFSGALTFGALLARVREVTLGAYAHQDLPFEKLVEEMQPDRSLSYAPLFQVMFAFQNVPPVRVALHDLTVHRVEVERTSAKFDLTLFMRESAGQLQAEWEYNTALFEAATMHRLAGHFQTLLEGIVAAPAQRLSTVPLLAAAEQHQLLRTWTAPQTAYPQDRGLHTLFEAQVERTPDAVAVVAAEQALTYRELNRRANQLAHYLQRCGVGPEVRVGLYLERTLEMVVGLLGILKAGGAYVPLDPAYPPSRLAFMLADAQVAVMLTQQRLEGSLPASDVPVVCLDRDWERLASECPANPRAETTGAHLAYVLYTSGSTGVPKGVLGRHGGAVNRLHWMWQRWPFAVDEVGCQKTSLSFVDSVWELFGPLLQGIRTVIVPDESVKDPHQLVALLATHGVTRLVLVPSLLRVLLHAYADLRERLPALRLWVSSGEALAPELHARFVSCMPQCVLLNLYGSSEVAADATWQELTVTSPGPTVPIGRPIANMQVYVLDGHWQPVPVGVVGELYVGGAGLARGYLNRPALTAERFVPHPYSAEAGARLYHTGDVGRSRPDGTLEFGGRRDHQVKLRGMRLELGEVEAVLEQHPGVREATVLVQAERPDAPALVAYYVGTPPVPDATTLRRFVQSRLPVYMVPTALVKLEAFPLTPNGKVDRLALPAPLQSHTASTQTYVASRNALELRLTAVWEKVLGVKSIGVRDNFFDLGGHSLLAVRLFAEINKCTGKHLPLATLFAAPTIAALADALSQQGWEAPWSSLVALQPGGSKPPLFLVHPIGGNVLHYSDIARRLGPDQPVYGIQPLGLDGIQPCLSRVEEMAAHYIAAIRPLQADGPYFLGGSSLGGMVAFEMARQLHAQGQQVALLALFDTFGPHYLTYPPGTPPWRRQMYRLADRIVNHAINFWARTPQDRRTYMLETTKNVLQKTRERLVGEADLPLAIQNVRLANHQAIQTYCPPPYAGRVTLFRARKQPVGIPYNPSYGWDRLALGGLDIYEVPGYHGECCRDPHARRLVEKLQRCLQQAQVMSCLQQGQMSTPPRG